MCLPCGARIHRHPEHRGGGFGRATPMKSIGPSAQRLLSCWWWRSTGLMGPRQEGSLDHASFSHQNVLAAEVLESFCACEALGVGWGPVAKKRHPASGRGVAWVRQTLNEVAGRSRATLGSRRDSGGGCSSSGTERSLAWSGRRARAGISRSSAELPRSHEPSSRQRCSQNWCPPRLRCLRLCAGAVCLIIPLAIVWIWRWWRSRSAVWITRDQRLLRRVASVPEAAGLVRVLES
jgi:hypothetical protein